jgi:hypothetical protein
MTLNITSNSGKPSSDRQSLLQPGQKVYLYDDVRYTGTLIRPMERTYPARWTVELDRGGFDSATLENITLLNNYPIKSDTAIPFSDSPDKTLSQLEREIIALKQENARLKQENQQLEEELTQAKQIIRSAKDISPVMRISLQRVMRLAHQACLDVQRTVGGWILKIGDKARKFRRLVDIWAILSQDNWYLSEIFPPEKLIPLDKIQPPKRRKRPLPIRFQTPPYPFPITREDFLRERELAAIASY